MKLTKIIATISDKHCEPEFIRTLYDAGMNIVRMNSAHLNREGFEKIVKSVRSVSPYIAIMMDTKGPEIRTTVNENDGKPIHLEEGKEIRISGDPDKETSAEHIYVNYKDIAKDVHVGAHILIDDGTLDLVITGIEGETIYARTENSGILGSRKSINIPGTSILLPAVSDRDKTNIKTAVELGVDFIAHSFVRNANDVREVKKLIEADGGRIKVISKIENQEGVDNFEEILEESFGIMIARGDLGIEVPAEKIPPIQRMMVKKCIVRHRPVIVATQMLHTMINNPRPTRAEVSDVAESVYQRADAIMLSGETANGHYPVEAVQTMSKIAEEIEHVIENNLHDAQPLKDKDITSFLCRQAVQSELEIETKAIITDAFHGRTARYLASFRGLKPVFAVCSTYQVARIVALSYGVLPFFSENYTHSRRYPVGAMHKMIENGLLKCEDHVTYLGTLDGKSASFLEISTVNSFMSYANDPNSTLK